MSKRVLGASLGAWHLTAGLLIGLALSAVATAGTRLRPQDLSLLRRHSAWADRAVALEKVVGSPDSMALRAECWGVAKSLSSTLQGEVAANKDGFSERLRRL